ncbi:hypothetical protein ACLMAJ_20835 [Nocardia sp. KC 131]|uniref:hypothetical protein n=1 Tax=Nocardia arseniciresistens TaxID=3392119 RepID=UPI00398F0F1C
MKSAAAQILDILDQVLAIVHKLPQDLTWQSLYTDEQELVDDLTDHAGRIRGQDFSRLPDLHFLFVTTGPLCEIAVSSGWVDAYAVLGNRFDELHAQLRRP